MHQIEPQNLLQLPNWKCTLGCPILDRLLDGGIPCNSVTEIVAESGSGKTQLCLQLLLSAQIPLSRGGLGAASIYIHSEFPFPSRRLKQISLSLLSSSSNNPLDRIFVQGALTPEELLVLLDRAEYLISGSANDSFPIKLIVIDSIAALFRSEFDNTPTDLKRRSSLFFKIAAKLKLLARKFNLAVVVSNQVTDLVGSGDGANSLRVGNYGALYSSGRRVCPALGLSWASCVNSRVFLSRTDEVVNTGGEGEEIVQTRRKMQVVFAPHLPESSCEFVILREGVFGVNF
ncbi:DNA repair protein XRCC3 homolog [Aristolochia californica]|uniref:DNA repair protein XRCC3 homolog n=1 Tax=Aristolochia californica TaxID=171875 RepID=UPI0035D79043